MLLKKKPNQTLSFCRFIFLSTNYLFDFTPTFFLIFTRITWKDFSQTMLLRAKTTNSIYDTFSLP